MNLNQLRVFHAVARLASVSAAARELHVSQPAVSKQLAELETNLGLVLVDRLPRGVRLTAPGRLLADYAGRLFTLEQEAEREMNALVRGSAPKLRVGASTTIGSYLAPQLFGTLRKLYPSVDLTLEIGNTRFVHELIRTEHVDLGLTEGWPATEDLTSRPFAEDELVAITAPSNPILTERTVSLERLLREPLLLRERGSGSREVLEGALRKEGHEAAASMELGSTEALKNAAASRLGVAFVSSLAVDLELRSGRLATIPVVNFAIKRSLHLVELRYRSAPPIVERFKELLATPPAKARPGEYAI